MDATETISEIDKRLIKLETRSEFFATKADVIEVKTSVIMWVVGTMLAAIALSSTLIFKTMPGVVNEAFTKELKEPVAQIKERFDKIEKHSVEIDAKLDQISQDIKKLSKK